MAKLVKGGVTFSNSHAAVADSFSTDDSQIDGSLTLNLLSQGDPGSASLYSIGQTNTTTTYMPTGTSGQVAVPTDLLTQDGVGYSITTDLGATVTILSSTSVKYDMSTLSDAEKTLIDNLDSSHSVTDTFRYAIKMADGTVSTSTVSVVISGHAGSVGVSDSLVVEDQHDGAGTITADGGNDPLLSGTLTDSTVEVIAKAASGAIDVGFTITPDAGNWGSLSSYSGTGDQTFTYTVDDSKVYDSHAGYHELAHTDTFAVNANDGATNTLTEKIYGNINAPNVTATLPGETGGSASVDEDGSAKLTITAGDHDDSANLSATITGLPDGATLVYDDGSGPVTLNANGDLTGDQLAALSSGAATLTLNAGEETAAPVTLDVHVTNTEYDPSDHSDFATASTDVTISLTVNPVAETPVFSSVSASAIDEGGTSDLTIAMTNADKLFQDSDDSVTFTVALSAGAALHGTGVVDNHNGTFTLTAHSAADLDGLTITPADGYDGGTITVDVSAVAHDGSSGSASVAATTADLVVHDETPTATSADAGSTANSASDPLSGNLSGSDSGDNDFTFALDGTNGGALHGTVVITNAATGAFTYTPNGDGFVGDDTFSFYTSDGGNNSTDATETVHLTSPVQPPVVSGDVGLILSNATALDISTSWLLAHASDPNSLPLHIDASSVSILLNNNPATPLTSGFTVNHDGSGNLTDISFSSTGQTNFTIHYTVSDGEASTAAKADATLIQTGGNTDSVNLSNDTYDFSYINLKGGNDSETTGPAITNFVYGGSGADSFVGTNGTHDDYIYNAASDSSATYFSSGLHTGQVNQEGRDTIFNFVSGGEDKIDLTALGSLSAAGALSGSTISAHSFGWHTDGSFTDLYVNTSNSTETITDGASYNVSMEIHLAGAPAITSSDVLHV